MRKVKYLLAFICLMLVSCTGQYYDQANNVMVVNSISKQSQDLHKYEIYVINKEYYWVLELIDDAGKYNVGDTLIIGKNDR